MVRGLERFKDHFRGYEPYFAVIGGTACDVWLTSRGLGFRRHVLAAAFGLEP